MRQSIVACKRDHGMLLGELLTVTGTCFRKTCNASGDQVGGGGHLGLVVAVCFRHVV